MTSILFEKGIVPSPDLRRIIEEIGSELLKIKKIRS